MLEFEYTNDFDRFINVTIYIFGINLLSNNENINMNMKISIEDLKKYSDKNFEIFQDKIENEVKKFIVKKIKENHLNVVDISKKNNISLDNIVQCIFINNKIQNIHIEWSSSSMKEFLYVPNKHYLIYFEDNLLLKTKRIKFDYL
tara:strand:+ start:985 stop:1419 length:435 start_codon:yes stop_codon:yes gene_type:complete